MTLIRNGLIGAVGGGGGTSASQLARADGLTCFTQSFTGITTTSFTHGLGSTDLVVEFQDAAGDLLVPDNWTAVNNNVLSVEFSGSTTGRVVIIACVASGLVSVTGGVTTIEGLSGIVDLDCPDNSTIISTSGQVINICSIFTPASGALLESLQAGGVSGGVTQLNNISGIINLTSPDESINVFVNGQAIELTTPTSGAPSGASYLLREYNDNDHLTTARILSATSGIRLIDRGARSNSGLVAVLDFDNEPTVDQVLVWNGFKLEWEDQTGVGGGGAIASGLASTERFFTPLSGTCFVVEHSLGTDVFAWDMWRTDIDPIQSLIPTNVAPSGNNHAIIKLAAPISGRIVFAGGLPIGAGAGGGGGISTQTSINGLSGTLFLTSPDGTILIGDSPQTIELSGLFTQASGAVLQQKCADIDTLSGLILADTGQTSINGLSGVVSITSPDGTILIGDGPQAVELSGLFTQASGQLLQNISLPVDAREASGNIIPDTDCAYDLGSELQRWRALYACSGFFRDRVGIGTSEPEHGLHVSGLVSRFEGIAAESGVSLIEIVADANGFNDVNAITIGYTTGPKISGVDGVVLLGVNRTAASGGTVVGLGVLTNSGIPEVYGLFGGPGVNPIVQIAGQFNSMDAFLVEDFDETNQVINPAVDTAIFEANSDEIIIGHSSEFEQIFFNLTLGSSGGGVKPQFEFSLGIDVWTVFSPLDTTNGFRDTGLLAWQPADVPGWAPGTSGQFQIRITRTRNSLQTTPLVNTVNIAPLTALYQWDKDGVVTIGQLGVDRPNPTEAIDLVGNILVEGHVRPHDDCLFDLGTTALKWAALHACSGAFTNELTLGGTNVALTTDLAGQTSVNGLSGAIIVDSPNSSIAITEAGQIISLDAIFTWASGQILEQKCRDIIILSGLILPDDGQTSINGISGVVTLDSPDDSVNINVNGQSIEVTTPGSGAPSGVSYLLREYNDNDHLTDARILSATSGIRLLDRGARSGSGLVITLDFQDQPFASDLLSWNGSGLEWVSISDTQTVINGLSGAVTLATTNSSIAITEAGQTINLDAIFTWGSGQILEQKCRDIITLSGLILPDGGQTSINGISGLTTLDSPDESINININGQSIEITTPTSGAPSGASYLLQEYNDNEHLTSARILSSTSGIRLIDRGVRSNSGLVAVLDFDNEPAVDQVLVWNGFKLQWEDQTGTGGSSAIASGLASTERFFTPLSGVCFVVEHSLGTDIFTWDMWRTDTDPIQSLIPTNVAPSGDNHAIVKLAAPISGRIVFAGGLSGTGVGGGSAGVTSIEGLQGVVDLDSPDESVNINVNGQIIELTTPGSGHAPSGASYILIDYDDNDHLVKARRLSATSGIVLDDQGARSLSGMVIKLDFEDEPAVDEVLSWNGTRLEWVSNAAGSVASIEGLTGVVDLDSPDGTVLINVNGQVIELTVLPDEGQTSINGLSGTLSLTSPDNTILIGDSLQTIELSGLFTQASGAVLQQKCVDILTLSGLIIDDNGQTSINGISGVVTLDSPDESINISVNGQSIEVTTPTSGAPSGASYLLREYNDNDHLPTARVLSATSGIRVLDRGVRSNSGLVITLDFQDEPAATDLLSWNGSGLEWITPSVDTQTSVEGLSGTIDLDSPDGTIIIGTNGQAIELTALPDAGQTSVEGLSGVIDLDSPDDSINVNVNGQTIEVTTPTSGAPSGASYLLREYNDNDHLVDARILSATSGIRLLDRGARSNSGLVVTLDFQDEPVATDVLTWNGSGLEWITIPVDTQTSVEGLSGTIDLDSPDGTVLIGINGQTIELTVLPDEGQTSVEGLSGVVDLDSPDESININTVGQVIELTTPVSGAPSGASYILIDYNDNNHLVDARKLTATSGIILDDQGARSTSGIVAKLDYDNEPAPDQVLIWNGFKLEWADQTGTGSVASGLASVEIEFNPSAGTFFTLFHGLGTDDFVWDLWRRDVSPLQTIIPTNVAPSGDNHVIIELASAVSGRIVIAGGIPDGITIGVQALEGLSGVIDLDSPDGTVIINVNGQVIELTVLPDEGQTSINGLSGTLSLTSPDNSILIGESPQTIELSGLFTQTSGALLEQKCEDINIVSGVANSATQKVEKTFTSTSGLEFVLEHGLATDMWTTTMWRTDSTPQELLIPSNIYPSGTDHAVVVFESSDSNPTGYQGRVVFIG